MKRRFTNNTHLEVLYAHFHHFYYFADPSVKVDPTCNGDGYCPFPEGFFNPFLMKPVTSFSQVEKLQAQEIHYLKNLPDEIPQLKGVEAPIVIYNKLLWWKINIKQITVPNYDGRKTIVSYRYHFIRLRHLIRFLFTLDKFRQAEIYNEHLKTRIFNVVPEIERLLNFEPEPAKECEEENQCSHEFTIKRQCITVLQLLTVLGMDMSRVNLSDVARFIHLLSAKDVKTAKLCNSNIYKMLKKLRRETENITLEDYQVIKKVVVPMDNLVSTPYLKKTVNALKNKVQ